MVEPPRLLPAHQSDGEHFRSTIGAGYLPIFFAHNELSLWDWKKKKNKHESHLAALRVCEKREAEMKRVDGVKKFG